MKYILTNWENTMKIKNEKTFKKLCLTAVVLAASLNMQSVSAAVCNAGDHWVDSCTGGTDNFTLTGAFGLNFTGLGFFDITVTGSGAVLRSDPDASGQINIEILSANMTTNNLPVVGAIDARFGIDTGVATPTLGVITETSDPSIATSYFDIFLEVDTPLGVFSNPGALRLTADITEWLPGESILYRFDLANSNLDIVDSGGLVVGSIDDLGGNAFMSLSAVPIPPSVFLFASGLIGLIGISRHKKLA
ncbi:hypothetical protein MNBD_GAMMA06-2215 [hydrothermal vent metagenome]|uniref:Uncharacterized protein n=1 Tax=hydrothermal vent metagenome TaxID=652676 RepID=A0A3B0WPG6_9ZZZZ